MTEKTKAQRLADDLENDELRQLTVSRSELAYELRRLDANEAALLGCIKLAKSLMFSSRQADRELAFHKASALITRIEAERNEK